MLTDEIVLFVRLLGTLVRYTILMSGKCVIPDSLLDRGVPHKPAFTVSTFSEQFPIHFSCIA